MFAPHKRLFLPWGVISSQAPMVFANLLRWGPSVLTSPSLWCRRRSVGPDRSFPLHGPLSVPFKRFWGIIPLAIAVLSVGIFCTVLQCRTRWNFCPVPAGKELLLPEQFPPQTFLLLPFFNFFWFPPLPSIRESLPPNRISVRTGFLFSLLIVG